MTNPYLTPTAGATTVEGADAGDDLVVEVTAYQWGWDVHYPDSNVTVQDRIVIPQGQDVRFVLTTEDVVHSIYVPQLGIKQDIFPGEEQVARTKATATGEHRLYCAELCGRGHTQMKGTVVVMEQGEFDDWLASGGNRTAPDRMATPDGNATVTATATSG
jgi:cytochrome c oxidase subunit 2